MLDFFTKVRQADEGGAYKTVMELPGKGRIAKAVIRAARECRSQYLYQVLSRDSEMYFKTLAEAKAYCKNRGWM
ncbi:MAG: hypothetical protein DDT21_02450 [Syntrophomonadaceae bacterium]|nr:hypothetical protein [Bacillota bacterium]